MWGVFDFREEYGQVHAVPVNSDNEILKPHTMSLNCICEPDEEIQPETGYSVIIHHGPDKI